MEPRKRPDQSGYEPSENTPRAPPPAEDSRTNCNHFVCNSDADQRSEKAALNRVALPAVSPICGPRRWRRVDQPATLNRYRLDRRRRHATCRASCGRYLILAIGFLNRRMLTQQREAARNVPESPNRRSWVTVDAAFHSKHCGRRGRADDQFHHLETEAWSLGRRSANWPRGLLQIMEITLAIWLPSRSPIRRKRNRSFGHGRLQGRCG